MMTLLTFALSSLSLAQVPAHEQAEHALRVELGRDGIAVTPARRDEMFRDACSAGYRAACKHNTWLEDGDPVPGRVEDTFRASCEANDPVACLALSWALDREADAEPSQGQRDALYREAIAMLTEQCDKRGVAFACHDMANLIYERKGGLTLDDPERAATLYWDKACDRGEYAACTELSRRLRDGARLKTKRKSAYDYAKVACDNGFVEGCYLLAEFNRSGWDAEKLDRVYSDLCDKGHTDSCYSLARTYLDGVRPEPEPGRAQELFERACALEHARSCFEAGRGTPEVDMFKAADYFSRACELEDAAGCKGQVDLILKQGQSSDVGDNLRAFEVACEQRQSDRACEWLAYYLLDADSPKRDFSRGRALLQEICDGESAPAKACYELGKAYEGKIGGPRDRTDAVKYYRWACRSGTLEACHRAAGLLEKGEGVTKDDAEALALFGHSCEGGLSTGCTSAGDILTYSVQIPRSEQAASEWYAKGCDLRNAESCHGLGEVLERGIDGDPDLAAARIAYQRAINEGKRESKTRLAYLYWNGFGGKKSKRRARQLTRDACQEGHDDACRGPAFLNDLPVIK